MKTKIIILAVGLFTISAMAQTATTNSLVIHADQGTNIISRMIYGQFSEHLGHCIYGGIYARYPQ